ncbi:MAG: chemotaxis protein CheW [Candidatus Sericytochromatia bacterium]|nr:chemotaxis protein CheW [Candidatus Sericytochromatia bacterium]
MLFVLFKSLDSIFSIEANHTLEISRMVNITSLPSESGKINALVNYRGRTIPVLDVCKYLENGQAQYNNESVIIIIEYKNQAVGLLAHDVIDMITVEATKVQEYKVLNSDYFNSAIQIGSTIVPILNPKKILLDVVDSMELMKAST